MKIQLILFLSLFFTTSSLFSQTNQHGAIFEQSEETIKTILGDDYKRINQVMCFAPGYGDCYMVLNPENLILGCDCDDGFMEVMSFTENAGKEGDELSFRQHEIRLELIKLAAGFFENKELLIHSVDFVEKDNRHYLFITYRSPENNNMLKVLVSKGKFRVE